MRHGVSGYILSIYDLMKGYFLLTNECHIPAVK